MVIDHYVGIGGANWLRWLLSSRNSKLSPGDGHVDCGQSWRPAKLITRYRRERCVQGPWWSGGQDGNSGQWEWQMRGRTEVREGGGLGDGVSVVCAGRRPGQSLLDSSLAVTGKCSDFIN